MKTRLANIVLSGAIALSLGGSALAAGHGASSPGRACHKPAPPAATKSKPEARKNKKARTVKIACTVVGEVSTFDGSTLTVLTHAGSKTVAIGENTVVLEDGVAVDPSEIAIGDRVQVKGTLAEAGVLTAQRILILPAEQAEEEVAG